ncbi:MAG: FtsX-like permease family protein, partial [Cyanothece sp. SIO1E1]|nr:FtsX-like permease family protein [Cyanothece sp. SIO1E1]
IPWLNPVFFTLILGSALVVGIFAGIYPAIYLSGFKPINVLKGAISQGSKNARMQSGLVVFQFTTSIILIIGTAVIHRQMQYILNKKLGFDKEQVVLLKGAHVLDEKVLTLKEILQEKPAVQQVTISDYLPIAGSKRNENGFWKEGKLNEDSPVSGQKWRVDHDYVKTMGMKIVKGRDFSLEMPTDSQGVIINEQMALELGLKDPIGKRITNSGAVWSVIGVVEDFHFESLKSKISPLLLEIGASTNTLSVKVNTEDMAATIASIKNTWDEISPQQPIRYTFLDQSYAQMYADVQRMERIFTSFAILAIIVACLGLFALSAFMAEQRRKEIGIRKVLGASLNNLLQLLTQHFVILVTVSFVIAVPLAWYLMRRWLQDYAYPTPISWTDFILSGLITLFIALFTVGFQAVRAALSNPVEAIRSE